MSTVDKRILSKVFFLLIFPYFRCMMSKEREAYYHAYF